MKDLIHICLEPEAQGCGMTFNRFYVGSKYPYFISYRGKWLNLFCRGCIQDWTFFASVWINFCKRIKESHHHLSFTVSWIRHCEILRFRGIDVGWVGGQLHTHILVKLYWIGTFAHPVYVTDYFVFHSYLPTLLKAVSLAPDSCYVLLNQFFFTQTTRRHPCHDEGGTFKKDNLKFSTRKNKTKDRALVQSATLVIKRMMLM